MRNKGNWDPFEVSQTNVALYDLDKVKAALGMPQESVRGHVDWAFQSAQDSEHQAFLTNLIARGEKRRWRHALGPPREAELSISALIAKAPHFSELGKILRINATAARHVAIPMFLNPIALVGDPGIGKTWIASKLAHALGLPFRSYSMSASTLGEGVTGSHPSWRNAEPGLVAKALLREPVANPLIFIDEFDKVAANQWNVDPYRPFYSLFEPSGAETFIDEYCGFPINASKVLWIVAANDLSQVPAPILDRLTVLQVPQPSPEMRMAVIQSIYEQANTKYNKYFEHVLERSVVQRLTTFNSRGVRLAIEAAMATAAAEHRHKVQAADIKVSVSNEIELRPWRRTDKRLLN
jgi:ATP-dependent Lon protease